MDEETKSNIGDIMRSTLEIIDLGGFPAHEAMLHQMRMAGIKESDGDKKQALIEEHARHLRRLALEMKMNTE